jgi:hypothetical protein
MLTLGRQGCEATQTREAGAAFCRLMTLSGVKFENALQQSPRHVDDPMAINLIEVPVIDVV